MVANFPSLTQVRLNTMNLESGMNNGAAIVEGNVHFTVSAKLAFTVGGSEAEPASILARVDIKADAVLEEENLLRAEVEFLARFEFSDITPDDQVAALISDNEFCEMLALQLQPYINAKFSDFVNMVGLELYLPLNVIRLRPTGSIKS